MTTEGRISNPFSRKDTVLLQALVYANPKQRQGIIRHADKKLLICICECSLNLVKGNVDLTLAQKKKLKKHKSLLYRLAGNANLKSKKRIIISQSGGSILPIILLPVLSAILGGKAL